MGYSRFQIGAALVVVTAAFLALFSSERGLQLFQGQLLSNSTQEQQPVLLIKQNTDPVSFDIYYQQLKSEPRNLSITIINALLEKNESLRSRTQVVSSVLLETGEHQIISTQDQQIINISNMRAQNSTRLGSLITNIANDEWVSLEYDVESFGKNYSIITPEVPKEYQDKTLYQNPFSFPIILPFSDEIHLLGPGEKGFIPAPAPLVVGPLIEGQITSYQAPESLTSSSLIAFQEAEEPPALELSQQYLTIPELPNQNYNLLLIELRKAGNEPILRGISLEFISALQLNLPPKDLLDFYDEINYSFAFYSLPASQHLSNSSIEKPLLRRSQKKSLVPDLIKLRSQIELEVSITPPQLEAGERLISFVDNIEWNTFRSIIHRLQQHLPLNIIDQQQAQQIIWAQSGKLPYIYSIGSNAIIWRAKPSKLEVTIPRGVLEPIAFESIPDLTLTAQLVRASESEEMICIMEQDGKAFSVPVTKKPLLNPGDCLRSATRLGLTSGNITVLKANTEAERLELLLSTEVSSADLLPNPKVVRQNADSQEIFLNAQYPSNTKAEVLIANNPSFEFFQDFSLSSTSPVSYLLPSTADCENGCYLKLSVQNPTSSIRHLSKTFFYQSSGSQNLHYCPSNVPELESVLSFSDLRAQITGPNGNTEQLVFDEFSNCFERDSDGILTTDPDAEAPSLSALDPFLRSDLALLPPNSIIVEIQRFSKNGTVIPVQHHYGKLLGDHVFMSSPLVFERQSLIAEYPLSKDLKKIPDVSDIFNEGKIRIKFQGNLITFTNGNEALQGSFLDAQGGSSEIIEFPFRREDLKHIHTLRIKTPGEVFRDTSVWSDQSIHLIAEALPEGESTLKLNNPIRQGIQSSSILPLGDDQFIISGENLSGEILAPIKLQEFLPLTNNREEIVGASDFFTMKTTMKVRITPPGRFRSNSPLDPFILDEDEDELSLLKSSALQSLSVESSQFLTESCSEILSFNTSTYELEQLQTEAADLESCLLQIEVQYLKTTAEAESSGNSILFFKKLFTDQLSSTKAVQEIDVPLSKDLENIDDRIALQDPLEGVIETDSSYVSPAIANTEESLIGIDFDDQSNSFVIFGSALGQADAISKYFRAINSRSGEVERFQITLTPTPTQEIIIPIVTNFPHDINITQILGDELIITGEESFEILESTLPKGTQVFGETLRLDGRQESDGHKISVLINKAGERERVDFIIKTTPGRTIKVSPFSTKANRSFVIDLNTLVSDTQRIEIPQLPQFLKQQGSSLIGMAPATPQTVDVLIKDYVSLESIVVPIDIQEDDRSALDTISDDTNENTAADQNTDEQEVPSTDDDDDDDLKLLDNISELKGAASTDCFPDIFDQPIAYQEAICYAKAFDIISGSGGKFNPNDRLNRAELAKILLTGPAVLFNVISAEEARTLQSIFDQQSFADVKRTDWFYGFVEAARELGIVSGHPDGNFKPGNNLLQAEAAKVLSLTLVSLIPETFSTSELPDRLERPGDSWFAPHVRFLLGLGGDFNDPEDIDVLSLPISRAKFIYNLMIAIESKSGSIVSLRSEGSGQDL